MRKSERVLSFIIILTIIPAVVIGFFVKSPQSVSAMQNKYMYSINEERISDCLSGGIDTQKESLGHNRLCAKAADSPYPLSAGSWCLIESDTMQIISGEGYDKRRGMASTTKIMSAIVALDIGSPDDIVTVTEESAGVEGSSAYLKVGEKLKLCDLVYAMMLASANDAASAIAIHIGGSIQGFADLMNAKAKSYGLVDTSFKNPHGLDDDGHYTTARELAIISAKAMENSMFAKIVSTRSYTFSSSVMTRTVTNHNKLLYVDSVCGVKTGFTKACGRCLVSAAEKDGVKLVMVTLNDPNDWRDHKAMLEWGFSLCETADIAKKGKLTYDLSVIGGVCKKISVSNAKDIEIIRRKGENVRIETDLERFVYAPIKCGAALGSVKIYASDGCLIECVDLVSDEACEKLNEKISLKDRIRMFFGK